MQMITTDYSGVPLIIMGVSQRFAILEKLSWRSNKTHILRSLVVTYGLVTFMTFAALHG
jgi:hypothetical protein